MLSKALLSFAAIALLIDLAFALRPSNDPRSNNAHSNNHGGINPGGNVGQGVPTTNADLDCNYVWVGLPQPEAIGVCANTVMADGNVSFSSFYESTPWPRVYGLGYALPDCAGAGLEDWTRNVTEADTHLGTGYLCAVISWQITRERIFKNGDVKFWGAFASFVQIDACMPTSTGEFYYKIDKCKDGKAHQHYYKDAECSRRQRWAPGKLHDISEPAGVGWDFFSYQRPFFNGKKVNYRFKVVVVEEDDGSQSSFNVEYQYTADQVKCIPREQIGEFSIKQKKREIKKKRDKN